MLAFVLGLAMENFMFPPFDLTEVFVFCNPNASILVVLLTKWESLHRWRQLCGRYYYVQSKFDFYQKCGLFFLG